LTFSLNFWRNFAETSSQSDLVKIIHFSQVRRIGRHQDGRVARKKVPYKVPKKAVPQPMKHPHSRDCRRNFMPKSKGSNFGL
jgi:hypothetical protein